MQAESNSLPSPNVRASGQTVADILGLLNLAELAGENVTIPPGFLDPNYTPSSHNEKLLNGIMITTVIISSILVFIKFYVRTSQCGFRYTLDDIILIIGYLMFLTTSIMVLLGINMFQWGHNVYDMKLSSVLACYRLLYIYEILFTLTLTAIRLSLLFMLDRLFHSISRGFRVLVSILIGINLIFGVGSVLGYTFQCGDPRAAFDIYAKLQQRCKPLKVYWIVSAFQLALDFASVLVPIKLVSALSGLTTKKKMEVLIMFSLGLSACSASIARCVYLRPVVEGFGESEAAVRLTIWCQVEATLALISACIPAARLFFGPILEKKNPFNIPRKIVQTIRSATNSNKRSNIGSMSLHSQANCNDKTRDSQSSQSPYGHIIRVDEPLERIGDIDDDTASTNLDLSKEDIENPVVRDAGGADVPTHGRLSPVYSSYNQPLRIEHADRPSPWSSLSSPRFDYVPGIHRPKSPPRSVPRLGVERPSFRMKSSFETNNSGMNSSTNSLELTQWDTLELHEPAPLTPRPHSSGRDVADG